MTQTTETKASKDAVGCKAWRRARLDALCREAAERDVAQGLKHRGAAQRMAARLDLAPTALSNMVHGAKNIGDESARSIESKLGLEPGALDAPPLSLTCETPEELEALRSMLAHLRALSAKAAD